MLTGQGEAQIVQELIRKTYLRVANMLDDFPQLHGSKVHGPKDVKESLPGQDAGHLASQDIIPADGSQWYQSPHIGLRPSIANKLHFSSQAALARTGVGSSLAVAVGAMWHCKPVVEKLDGFRVGIRVILQAESELIGDAGLGG